MPAVVTFDGPNRRIIEIAAGSNNELDVTEIYSEWKEWVKASPANAAIEQAFRQVGGDPVSDVQNLGSTFFLMNGWKIRPAELNHKLTLVGNLFTDPAGESVFVPTLGSFTVNTETKVSNLVDSAVSRLDLAQLQSAVFIDTVNGVPGTDEGIGTPTNPVNNIADAFTIANRDKLRAFVIAGSIALDRNVPDWSFSAEVDGEVDVTGFSVERCSFEELHLTGTATYGHIHAHDCEIDGLGGVHGTLKECELTSLGVEPGSDGIKLIACGAADPSPVVSFSGITAATSYIQKYSGELHLTNIVAAGCGVVIGMASGTVTIEASCTAGSVLVRGVGTVVDNSGPGCTVNADGLVSPASSAIATWEAAVENGAAGSMGERMRALLTVAKYLGLR